MDRFSSLPEPEGCWALFLDVDGTLVEIAETPEGVALDARLVEILSGLEAALGGAVALVSGRPIATLDRLFAPLRLPAAGLHGLERRDAAGATTRVAVSEVALRAARRAFAAFVRSHPGTLIEDKELTVALHFRGAPACGESAAALAEEVTARGRDGLRVQHGKQVVEVRPDGPDKGTAVEAFMAEAPFKGRVPVFIGDDVTDERGFEMVNRMGGHSIRIGRGVATAARRRIGGVGALLRWLETVLGAVEAPQSASGRGEDDRP